MALRYRIPLPGPFYYSGRVGPRHWLPRSRHTGTGSMGFVVKWFIVYPSIVIFGAGLAIMVAPFYGVFWVVRRSLRNRRKCQPVARRFPVQRPYGFVPALRPTQPVPYGFVPTQRGVLLWRVGRSARIGRYELGCPLLLDCCHVLCSVIVRGGGHDCMRPITRCSGVMGRRVWNQPPGV